MSDKDAIKCVRITDARARISELVDHVDRTREPITITRNGRPVARLVPAYEQPTPEFLQLVRTVVDDEKGVLKALE